MAFVALTSLMETIRLELLQSAPRVSLDAENLSYLQAFQSELSHFQAFLQKPSGGGSAPTIKHLKTKIRDFALKAEDQIETQLHSLLLAKHQAEKASRALHQAVQEATQNAVELSNIINTTISSEADVDAIKTLSGLKTQPAVASRSENVQSSEGSWWRSPEKVFMIGRGRDCDVIKDKLLRGSSELGLIPIVGMVGIGKTTLVKSIYTDPALLSHFQVRGGVTMRPELDKTQMLSDLLRSINVAESNDQTKEGIITTTTADLANQLRKCLNGKSSMDAIMRKLSPNGSFNDSNEAVQSPDSAMLSPEWDYSNRIAAAAGYSPTEEGAAELEEATIF